MVQQAGFEPVAVQAHGQPRSRLLHLYLTVLARPSSGGLPSVPLSSLPIRPETRVAFKRKAGIQIRRLIERLLPAQAWLPVDRMNIHKK
jgi:hypothetical protein